MVAHKGFDIAIKSVEGECYAQITRPGKIRHFQPKDTYTRIFSVDYGPFKSEDQAEEAARAAIDEGFWEF